MRRLQQWLNGKTHLEAMLFTGLFFVVLVVLAFIVAARAVIELVS